MELRGKLMQDYRREHDSLGEVKVDSNAFYGANALRARENFNITGKTCDDKLIDAIVEVKKACAIENEKIGLLTNAQKEAIISACNLLLGGSYRDNFIVDPIQGGAGTSFNMNANEVIANMANQSLGGNLGVYDKVHPNDHVNKGQSTNDVIPTSGKIALIRYFKELYDENIKLINAIEDKADEFKEVYKMGRTQLQDAIPISLGQEFAAYAKVFKRDNERFKKAIQSLSFVNLGGTAIGTGLNADKTYVKEIVPVLAEVTGLNLKQNEDLIDGTQNLDGFTYSSSILKTYASNLSKIANDLRLMSSGPQVGIADIKLPARQAGSSAGANVMLFDLHEKIDRERYKEKIKIFKFFKENIINYSLKYLKISLLYVSLILILAVDLFYFSTSINPLFTGLFYLNIIMAFVIVNSMTLSFYLMAIYPEMKFAEIAKNAIALVIVNIIDILVLNAFLAAIAMIFYKISDLPIFILLPGIFIDLSYYIFNKMLNKRSLTYLLFSIK